jgi:hypothetical protein
LVPDGVSPAGLQTFNFPPHVTRIAGKTQEAACRWLFDRGVNLFDKITLHDAPHCMVDPASQWPEVATVVRKVVLMKFWLNFVACYGTSKKCLVICSELLRSAGFTKKYLLILLLKYYFTYRSAISTI